MSTLVNPTQFKARYPEFSALDDTIVQTALDDADEEINVDVWGTRAAKGESALAAHLLVTRGALNDPGATGMQGSGPVQNMKVGDVSLSFDVNAIARGVEQGLEVALATTKYGLEYTRLLKSLAAGGAVTGGGCL